MNDATRPSGACVACGRSAAEVPLLAFAFRGREHHICSQHLPWLIHDPARLAAMLPGAEGLEASEHHD